MEMKLLFLNFVGVGTCPTVENKTPSSALTQLDGSESDGKPRSDKMEKNWNFTLRGETTKYRPRH